MDRLYLRYDYLEQVIKTMLGGFELSHEGSIGLSVSTHVSLYWPTPEIKLISDLSDAAEFVKAFKLAFDRTDKEFIQPYMDVGKTRYCLYVESE